MKKKYTKIKNIRELPDTLFKENNVVIPNLGRFELRIVKSRSMYNNLIDGMITTKKGFKVHFIPYGKLKKLCKK